MSLFYSLSIFGANILTQEVKVTHEDHTLSELGRDSGCFGIGGSPVESIEVPKDTIVGVFSEEGCKGKIQLIPNTEDRNVKSLEEIIDQGTAWIQKSAELGKSFNKPITINQFGIISEAPKQDPFVSFFRFE
ncbi:hypothetical protein CONCODRAFT_67600 [Conidiobolus coronatus NRRL 28638]|uniref:Uncharacterized protein n=1 Tax=Conidiobolus coronatus (strain ATCC 28846 / CBS 209.66 / NRRL 28638) TaxID=796925 RepID=A0A137PGX7_CONC2|nr:hypothetical protein CONCODRAFT_67600 [Conidiobolus coronatus NRRL 28638]|eukprot:KXN74257.1 hypothetical protein CONCODRAFT_67600 [Conidiobolus coronatus NRRL 28638]